MIVAWGAATGVLVAVTAAAGGEWGPYVSGAALVIAAMVTGAWLWINRKGGEKATRMAEAAKAKAAREASREGTWSDVVTENRDLRKELSEFRDETEKRFEAVDRKFIALERVLTAVAEQWPDEFPVPEFDPADIEELGTTMPVRFRPTRRTRAAKRSNHEQHP